MISNVLSLNEMTKKYIVTLNFGDKYYFRIHIGDKFLKFPADDEGLYLIKPDSFYFRKVDEYNKINIIEGIKNFQNVGENRNGFSERQKKRVLATRNIYHMVGAPSLRKLKMMIRQNIIQNFPVAVEEIEILDKIFGPDVSTLKERTTRQSPKVVVDDFIEIPRELIEKNQELML